ncbi:MAG TPA: hypothetical protein VJ873_06940 [bacterium]|nr:hypothetical protein [bacterium]
MPPFLIPAVLLISILVVIGAGPIAAKLGGWSRLAETYAAVRPFEGRKQLASGAMGAANYGFSLLLGADSQGFSLETTGFVRTGHAPLFIPWAEVKATETFGIFSPRVLVEFSKAPGVVLRLTKKTILELKERSEIPQAFPGIS